MYKRRDLGFIGTSDAGFAEYAAYARGTDNAGYERFPHSRPIPGHLTGLARHGRPADLRSRTTTQMIASVPYTVTAGLGTDGNIFAFVMMQVGRARLGLLAHPPNPEQDEGTVELNFETSEPLDLVEQRLRAAEVTVVQPVTDEGFGRQLQVAAPGGLLIKINELDGDLYT